MSLMTLDGFHARIDYDEETDLFRGEILGLNGGADFYGSTCASRPSCMSSWLCVPRPPTKA